MNRKLLSTVFLVSLLQVSSLFVGHAYAVEGGKSLYLLGKRGPLAGLIPKTVGTLLRTGSGIGS